MRLVDRFWSNVVKSDNCWLWIGPKRQEFGYGAFSVGAHVYAAHRIAYELEVDQIPSGLQVLHKCDTGACVKPDHLFLGTQKDNIHDMLSKGRFIPPHGSRSGTSKLSWPQVRLIRNEWRDGMPIAQLARKFYVSTMTIHDVL